MDKLFCEQIDREMLIEEYVQGRLRSEVRDKFEQHLLECDKHALAVRLEKILKKGVTEFARNQLRSTITRHHHQPQENLRVVILRYAAFLFVAVFVPLMLYYQFQVLQRSTTEIPIRENQILMGDSAALSIEKKQEPSILPADLAKSPSRGEGSGQKKISESPVISPATSVNDLHKLQIAKTDSAQPEEQTVPQTLPIESRTQAADKALSAPEQQPEKDRTYSVSGIKKQEDQAGQDLSIFIKGEMASGELTQQIAQQISRQEQELKNCLDQKNISGFFEIEFIISSQGVPSGIRIIKTNSDTKRIDDCIIEKIKNWKFDTLEQEIAVKKKFTFI